MTSLAIAFALLLSAGEDRVAHPPSAFASEMLAAHNAYRTALKLRPLKWSDKLAAGAQAWADTLLKSHRFYHMPNNSHGENLFEIHGQAATPDDVVHDWAAESLDYDYRSNRCSSVCGHYTQIVWSSTTEVGCAVARSGSREVWVCRYDPPGNVVGRKPY
ncbi:MAG TPA: CAP domain-containing protein [Bryobacteraceae bacterium]|nr:CAP domain-containing protein [Bryobacteraceae bacterium]